MHEPIILAIESSCDDTSAAILKGNKILSHQTTHQKIHQNFGGIVPEWASRKHQLNIVPVIDRVLKDAKVNQDKLEGIAFTRGPGLLGSLLVGVNFAKSMAMALNIPLIEVNHMQAHILAHFIEDANLVSPSFPFLCLTVSGGHTQIVLVRDYFKMKVVAQTRDDAVGEAFDKIGKILGLGYPAGYKIDNLAQKGNPIAFSFPIPNLKEIAFSYSGIKTAVMYFIQKKIKENPNFIADNLEDLCASIQYTLIESLLIPLKKAVDKYNINRVAIAGGVSANSELRKQINQQTHWKTYIPKLEYTTDNAAMIGMVGVLKYKRELFTNLEIEATAKYSI